jgi:hypothetical protein
MQVLERIRQELRLEMPLQSLFASPTLQEFAKCARALLDAKF